jgi:hypothetical protein
MTKYRAKNLDTGELGPIREFMSQAIIDMLPWEHSTYDVLTEAEAIQAALEAEVARG